MTQKEAKKIKTPFVAFTTKNIHPHHIKPFVPFIILGKEKYSTYAKKLDNELGNNTEIIDKGDIVFADKDGYHFDAPNIEVLDIETMQEFIAKKHFEV